MCGKHFTVASIIGLRIIVPISFVVSSPNGMTHSAIRDANVCGEPSKAITDLRDKIFEKYKASGLYSSDILPSVA